MSNRLIKEKSPYLRMHAENPVDWFPWGEEAFSEAKKRDLPIFLSIGYSSCHWCHVMENESFVDNETAEILNNKFISIKVDREELSDIDHFYMEACQAFTGSGGWPLSAFLTHSREPFFAGTYFPPEDGMRGIGFKTLLNKIYDLWQNQRENIIQSGKTMISHLKSVQTYKPNEKELSYDDIIKVIKKRIDYKYGGMEGAPKFPSSPWLIYMLQYNKLKNNSIKDIIVPSLSKMATGGIFDHIGGGFFRYSTDEKWLVPHFEKMLYDNALLLYVYSAASELNNNFEYIAQRTADYMLGEMLSFEGGFYTAEDADSEGVEGKFYLFSQEEIYSVLGKKQGKEFCSDYDITEKGNFEGKNIPNRIGKDILLFDNRLEALYHYRKNRIAPMKDDKIITSSNALAVAAFAFSGRVLNKPFWIKQAEKTADFILDKLYQNNRLLARYKEGEAAFKATLEDYSFLLWALSELYSSTLNYKWLDKAINLADEMISLFSDEDSGLYLSGHDSNELPFRMKRFYDGPIPSGNAAACNALIDLYEHTRNEKYKKTYEGILKAGSYSMTEYAMGCFGLLSAKMKKDNLIHLGIAEGIGLDEFLLSLSSYKPFLIKTLFDDDYKKRFPRLYNKSDRESASAFVCDNKGCKPPIYKAADLRNLNV